LGNHPLPNLGSTRVGRLVMVPSLMSLKGVFQWIAAGAHRVDGDGGTPVRAILEVNGESHTRGEVIWSLERPIVMVSHSLGRSGCICETEGQGMHAM